MEFRKSQWTESISSLLRKTELNLIRIQTPYHEEYPRSFGSVTYHTSFYDNGAGEPIQRPPTDFKEDTMPIIQQEINTVKSSLEKLLHERLRSQKKEIEDIGDRLSTLEVRSQDLDRFKEETKISLNGIEKRCLTEIKRIENSGKGFVTKEDLSIATESIARANLTTFKHLEQEIEGIKGGDFDVKQEFFRMTEEKIREASKKFVSVQEFGSFKESISRDYEERTRELEESISYRLEKFKSSYEREGQSYENRIADIKRDFEEKENSLNRKLREIEVATEKNQKKQKEEKEKVQAEIEKLSALVDTTEIEYRLDALEQGLKKLPKDLPQPDLSGLVQRQDLVSLQNKLVDLETYKKNLNSRIDEVEKRVQELEVQASESSDIDIDLAVNKDFAGKGAATFGKLEEEKKAGFSYVNIEDVGESDSDSNMISPHTSPMNQLSGVKKPTDFDFKPKLEAAKKKSDLNVVDEYPDIENQDQSYSKSAKPEVKHFPVETVKVENKKGLEESGKVKGKEEEKKVNLFIPEIDKKGVKKESESEDSDSGSSDSLGLSKNVKKPSFNLGNKDAKMGPAEVRVENKESKGFGVGKDQNLAAGNKEIKGFGLGKDQNLVLGANKPDLDLGRKENVVKPVQKVVTIEDDEDEFGLFSKPNLKPGLNLKEIKPAAKNESAEISKLIDQTFENFTNNEFKYCFDIFQSGQSRGNTEKKIPTSIKGMDMHKLLSKNSSSEESDSGSGSVEFSDNIDLLP